MSRKKENIREKKNTKINTKTLLSAKPFDSGPGSERTSIEIDEILYGSRKKSFSY